MAPIRVIPCNMKGCEETFHTYLSDTGPKLPWYCESHRNSCLEPGQKALKPGEHPTTTLNCAYAGCTAGIDFDVADQIPSRWRCPRHSNLRCQHEGCDGAKPVDPGVDIDTTYWWCPEHATEVDEAQLIVAQQPTIDFLKDYVAQQVHYEEKAYLQILEMIQFKTLSKENLERVLNILSNNCYSLGRKDAQNA